MYQIQYSSLLLLRANTEAQTEYLDTFLISFKRFLSR